MSYHGFGQIPAALVTPTSTMVTTQPISTMVTTQPIMVETKPMVIAQPIPVTTISPTQSITAPPVETLIQKPVAAAAPKVEAPRAPAPTPPSNGTQYPADVQCLMTGGTFDYINQKCNISPYEQPVAAKTGIGTIAVIGAAALAALLLFRR